MGLGKLHFTRESPELAVDARRFANVVHVPITMHWMWAPLGLLLILPAPALVGSLLLPPSTYPELFEQPYFMSSKTRWLATIAFLVLLLATLVVKMSPKASGEFVLDSVDQRWLDKAVRTLAFVTFSAYTIWFVVAIMRGLNGSVIEGLVRGDPGTMYALRSDYFVEVSGVTTWMQTGSLLAPLTILRARAQVRSSSFILTALIGLSATRAFLDSERLALIEIVVSCAVASLVLRPEAPRASRSVRGVVAIYAATLGSLFMFFSAFEYFRSWKTQGTLFAGGFWEYSGSLFLGYYATALNLASFDAALLQGRTWIGYMFDGNIYTAFFKTSPTNGAQKAYGLETFTNRSGLLTPDNALGVAGEFAVFLVLITVTLIVAHRIRNGGMIAFGLYCSMATGYLELVRIFYFGSSRFLPVVLWLLPLALSLGLSRRNGGIRSMRESISNSRGSAGGI